MTGNGQAGLVCVCCSRGFYPDKGKHLVTRWPDGRFEPMCQNCSIGIMRAAEVWLSFMAAVEELT
jgi:hypothetical protein